MDTVMTMLSLARDNRHEQIEKLSKQGLSVSVSNQMGQTPLHIAALWGNVETVRTLARLGADVKAPNMRGSTPLHFAANAKSNTLEVCQLLLSLGADPEAADFAGRVPYELASSDAVRLLLGGPDPRIFESCARGDAKALAELLATAAAAAAAAEAAGTEVPNPNSVSVRVMDSMGRTPLNLAIEAGSLETVQVILKHDPCVLDMPDAGGNVALHAAARTGHAGILRHLLELKPETLDMQNLDSSEYSNGSWMLKGETVEPLDKTPLAVAVAEGHLEAATLLLDAGALVDPVDYDRRTPLLTALEDGEAELVKLLLERGAKANQPSQDFVSGLHLLATRGPLELIALLASKGADVKAVNAEGWTPLHLAARAGKVDRAQALLQAGADVAAANKQGNTALHLAAINSHVPVIKLLRQHGASADAKNADGRTPADCAKEDAVRAAVLEAAL